MQSPTPTKQIYNSFDDAYEYFNLRLFEARLPPCLITVRPHRGAYGYYSHEQFGTRDSNEVHDEIALNIRTFKERTPKQIYSTLAHEMVHLEQFHFGKPSRGGYHNRECAELMERIGLMPSDTGEPGGKRTGQRVTHYVIPSGPFDLVYTEHEFVVPYFDLERDKQRTRGKRKLGFTCPSCDDKLWGKPGALRAQPHCGKCGLIEMVADENEGPTAEMLAA